MLCPYCQFEEEPYSLYCTDCGEAFYRLEVVGDAYYFDDSGRVDLPVRVYNNGQKRIQLEGVKYSREFFEKDAPVVRNTIEPGENHEVIAHLDGIGEPEIYRLLFTLTVDKQIKEIHSIDDRTIKVFPVPQLTTPDVTYEVDPLNGYTIVVPVTLENDSYAHVVEWRVIRRVRLLCGSRDDFSLTLSGEGDKKTIEIPLPYQELGPGEHPLLIQLILENFRSPITLIENLKVICYGLPSLRMEVRRYTDDGFAWQEAAGDIELNFPKGSQRVNKVRLTALKDGDHGYCRDFTYLTGYDAADFIKIDRGLEPGELFQRVLDMRFAAKEEDQQGELHIRSIDKRIEQGERDDSHRFHITSFEQQEYGDFIGIDFGTVNSCLALSVPEKKGYKWEVDPRYSKIQIMPIETSALPNPRIMPSVIGYDRETDGFFVGSDVSLFTSPEEETKLRNIKLALKSVKEEAIRPMKKKTPQELSSLIIEEMLTRTIGYLEGKKIPFSKIAKACVAVPTNYLPAWQDKIRNAVVRALDRLSSKDAEVKVVYESMAAIRYYIESHEKNITYGLKVIYDFGGGTTDVTAILAYPEKEGQATHVHYKIIGHSGDTSLGGRDVNLWVRELLVEKLAEVIEGRVNDIVDPLIAAGFWEESRKKEAALQVFDVLNNKKIEIDEKKDRLFDVFSDVIDEARREQIRGRINEEIYLPFGKLLSSMDDDETYDRIEALKINVNDKRRFSDNLFRVLEGKITNDDMKEYIHRRIEQRARLILADILNEIDTSRREIGFEGQKIEILLAGGSSSLFGFKDIVHRVAEELVASQYQGIYEIERTTIIPEPKECVAKGAFLYGGMPGRFEELNISPYDLLMNIPKDIEIEGVETINGQNYRYLMRRRCSLPYEAQFLPSEFGFSDAAQEIKLTVFAKYGIGEPEVYYHNLKVKNTTGAERIVMKVDTSGEITFVW